MYTQCPECLSVFSLDAHTLAKAHGYVSCGHCDAGFDSIATLAEQLPPEPFTELPVNEPAFEPPRVELVVYRPRPAPPAVLEAAAEPAEAVEPPADDFAQLTFAPRFAREKSRRKRKAAALPAGDGTEAPAHERHWPWALACALLALALLAQLGWVERDALVRNPASGAWLRGTCQLLGCPLPLVAAPARLRLLDSNVQAHPAVPGALMISASVRNAAPFAQPYPVLAISLSNARGERVAMRRLQPAEYLDDAAVLRRGLAPGATTVLLLEVADPGDDAVAFEFAFQ